MALDGPGTTAPGEEGAALATSMGVALPPPAPDRGADEGVGPFQRLVIDNAMLVDGLGAPPRGPVSLVIEQDTIRQITSQPPAPMAEEYRLDASGMTVLPGFVDAHVHIGNPLQGLAGPITPPEYVFKLWLAHGITTVRDVGSVMGLQWTVEHARRSDKNSIVAPSIIPYAMFTDRTIQHYPADYNYSDEQWRFGEAGNLWLQSAATGSPTWNDTLRELVDLDFTMVPTFTIYEVNRDVMRARLAEWHDGYTWPVLNTFFQPNPKLHGSYHMALAIKSSIVRRIPLAGLAV